MLSQEEGWQKDAADQDINCDYMFKLLVIGNSRVGKTSVLFQYIHDSFIGASCPSTLGINFEVKTVFRNDRRLKLRIWDTAGQERYRSIIRAYYRGAMGIILMYDVTDEESFSSVHDWLTSVSMYSCSSHTNLPAVVLVGNKCDMNDDDRKISYEQGKHLADALNVPFFETSASEPGGINVEAAFSTLVDEICSRLAEKDGVNDGVDRGVRIDNKKASEASVGHCC